MTDLAVVDSQVTGKDVAGLFDSRSDALTGEERLILATLLTRDDRVDLAVPDEMDAAELWRTLDICARVFVRVRRASGQLKLLIGRALQVIQKTPEVYESRGFTSFDAFMSDQEKGLPKITGISRAELFKAKAVASSMGPATNMEDIRQIGSFTKLQIIAAVSDAGSSTQKALMDAAKSETIPQLRERIARSNLAFENGDLEWEPMILQTTKTQKAYFTEFFADPQVRAYCGTESMAVILERAIEECREEWNIRAMIVEAEAREV